MRMHEKSEGYSVMKSYEFYRQIGSTLSGTSYDVLTAEDGFMYTSFKA